MSQTHPQALQRYEHVCNIAPGSADRNTARLPNSVSAD